MGFPSAGAEVSVASSDSVSGAFSYTGMPMSFMVVDDVFDLLRIDDFRRQVSLTWA